VSEQILNSTSSQLGYTVPFTLMFWKVQENTHTEIHITRFYK